MTTIEQRNAVLAEAKAIILQGWCQGAYARDWRGCPVEPLSSDAKSFCMSGALFKAQKSDIFGTPARHAVEQTMSKLGIKRGFPNFNDSPNRTVYSIASIFDHAMEQPL